MLFKEALWIKNIHTKYLVSEAGIALNIGSSTFEFIQYNQPYINEFVYKSINQTHTLLNVDIKNDNGVDIVADFMVESGRVALGEKKASLFLISNLLEHLPNPYDGISQIKKLIQSNSYLILTGPRTFPYHPDPIDNMFRPTLAEIQELFSSDFDIICLEVVKNGTVFSSTLKNRDIKNANHLISKKGGMLKLITSPYFLYKMIRNIFYPASAFCLLARKK